MSSVWEPWLLLSKLCQESPVGACSCSISWTLLCSSQLPAWGYFSSRGSLKYPVCNDHITNPILWVAPVCTRAQIKGCLRDKVNRKAIRNMNSYHETQLSRGNISTNLRNIDPFWYHDIHSRQLWTWLYELRSEREKKISSVDRNTILRSVADVYYGYSDYQLMCSCILWFCFKTILEGNNLKGNLLQRSGNWRTFGQSTC